MKAAQPDTPARLMVRQFHGKPFDKLVRLGTDWQRYQLEFTAEAEACYVLAGPDLRTTADNPSPPDRATVWLDALQLAKGESAPAFATRQPVELGIGTDKPGNVFAWDEPLKFHFTLASAAGEAREAALDLRLTDFFDDEVWHTTLPAQPPSATSHAATMNVSIPASPKLRGFLRLHVKLTSGKTTAERNMRLAVIPTYTLADSRFGMNHAFGWPEMLTLCKRAGLVWMRDWSMKWQDVEPEQGQFVYEETDAQVGRLLRKASRCWKCCRFLPQCGRPPRRSESARTTPGMQSIPMPPTTRPNTIRFSPSGARGSGV